MNIRRSAALVLVALAVGVGSVTPAAAANAVSGVGTGKCDRIGSYSKTTPQVVWCRVFDMGQPVPDGWLAYSFPNVPESYQDVAHSAMSAQGRQGTYGILNPGSDDEQFAQLWGPVGTADGSQIPHYPGCLEVVGREGDPPCETLEDRIWNPYLDRFFQFDYSASSFPALSEFASHTDERAVYYDTSETVSPHLRIIAHMWPRVDAGGNGTLD